MFWTDLHRLRKKAEVITSGSIKAIWEVLTHAIQKRGQFEEKTGTVENINSFELCYSFCYHHQSSRIFPFCLLHFVRTVVQVQIISKWACPAAWRNVFLTPHSTTGVLSLGVEVSGATFSEDIIAYIFLFYLVRHLNRPPINGLFSLDAWVRDWCFMAVFCDAKTIFR